MIDAPPQSDDDRGMRRVYGLVVVCHAAVITLLWWFGHVFSS